MSYALCVVRLPAGEAGQVSYPDPYQKLYDEVLAPVVKVTTAQGTGSGVLVSLKDEGINSLKGKPETFVLTAAHVVGDEREVQVIHYTYRRDAEFAPNGSGLHCRFAEIINATVIITDTYKDLALLTFTSKYRLRSAKLADRNYTPYLFTEIYAVGCSLGLDPRPSFGILSGLCASAVNRWEISAPVLPGNSGGGVFLKDTHELIGIIVWVRTYHGQLVTTMCGIVPINEIYDFLEKAKGLETYHKDSKTLRIL